MLVALQLTAKLSVVLGLLCCGLSAQAAGVYRWVDESGQVHFGNRPPPDSNDVQNLDPERGFGRPQIRVRKNYAYCGDQRLPGPLDDPVALLIGVHDQLDRWEEKLAEAERELLLHKKSDLENKATHGLRAYDSASLRRERSLQASVEQYRCMVEWGNRQWVELGPQRESLLRIPGELDREIASMETDRDRQCGDKPLVPPNHQLYLDWYYCREPFQSRPYKLEREQRHARRQAGRLQ